MSALPTYLTLAQASQVYGVTLNTLHTWRQGGTIKTALPATKAGREVRLDIKALEAWNTANGVKFVKKPETVLAKWVAKKPGPQRSALMTKASRKRTPPPLGYVGTVDSADGGAY